MNDLLVGVLTALLTTNSPSMISNLVHSKPPTLRKPVVQQLNTNSPSDLALKRIMEMDDQARAEIDDIITETQQARTEGADKILKERISKKLDPVRKAYEGFINQFPTHARGRIAFGAFLGETSDEEAAQAQWLKAKELDPKEPSVWNNLANYYGHRGPVTNAFHHYAKAIELNPFESTYYHNLATTVFMFRADASKLLKKSIVDVLYDAMALYRRALELDPTNFILAADLAQSYYGFPTPKSDDPNADRLAKVRLANEALVAWTNAYHIARDDDERQGVQVHFARQNINAGRFDIARKALDGITNTMYDVTKRALVTKMESQASGSTKDSIGTNRSPAVPKPPSSK